MPFDSQNTVRGSESAKLRYRLSNDVVRLVEVHALVDAIAAMRAEAPHLWLDREPRPGNRAIARAAAVRRRELGAAALSARVKSGMGEVIHCLPFSWAGHNLAVASYVQETSGCIIVEIGTLENPCQAIGKPAFPAKQPKKKRRGGGGASYQR